MTSGETLPRGDPGQNAVTGQTAVTGVVVVLHGGRSSGIEPTTAYQPAVLRMIPVTAAIRQALRGSGAVVVRPRFRVRGWNGEQASPVRDLNQALDHLAAAHATVPVVLVGHSMGARAAIRAAGHPAVSAVAGLAPWLPPGEPVGQLAGRRLLVMHGTADGVTPPADTWAYVDRARTITDVTAIELRDGDHAMLRRARLWHAIAGEFARAAFGLPAGGLAVALAAPAGNAPRTVL